jgi:hypothetical protein
LVISKFTPEAYNTLKIFLQEMIFYGKHRKFEKRRGVGKRCGASRKSGGRYARARHTANCYGAEIYRYVGGPQGHYEYVGKRPS